MKKTLLLSFICLLAFVNSMAQSDLIIIDHGVLEAGEIVEPGGTEDLSGTTQTASFETDLGDHVMEFWVENTSETETYTVRCRRIETDVVPGTTNNVCWDLCPISTLDAGEVPDWTVTTGSIVRQEVIGPGETATSFAFHYEPQNTVGISTFEVRFVSASDEDLTYTSFNIQYDHDGITGVEEIEKPNQFNLTPNPANETVSIDLEEISGYVDVKIYNVLGEVMIDRVNVQGGQKFELETSELQSGIYMVSVLENGSILNTSRLMVRH